MRAFRNSIHCAIHAGANRKIGTTGKTVENVAAVVRALRVYYYALSFRFPSRVYIYIQVYIRRCNRARLLGPKRTKQAVDSGDWRNRAPNKWLRSDKKT